MNNLFAFDAIATLVVSLADLQVGMVARLGATHYVVSAVEAEGAEVFVLLHDLVTGWPLEGLYQPHHQFLVEGVNARGACPSWAGGAWALPPRCGEDQLCW